MDHAKELGEQSIGRLLWKYSIPAIVGMLVTALYNIIDRIFVGHGVGLLAISATTVAFPISVIGLAFGLMLGIGASVNLSISLGQNKKEEAELIIGNTFTLTVLICAILTVTGFIYMEPMLKAFGASPQVMPLAKAFVSVFLVGTLPSLLGFVFNYVVRSEGRPQLSMAMMIVGTVINLILNPVFIFLFHLGIRGSALASVIAQSVGAIWVMSYLLGRKRTLRFRLANLKLRWRIVGPMLAIGFSSFIFQIVTGMVQVIFNQSLGRFGGDVAIAAMGIISTFSLLIMMPVFGITNAAQPIVGYNYGAGAADRVKRTLRLSTYATVIITTIGLILVEAIPGPIIRIFSSYNPELMRIGTAGMRIFLMALPINGYGIIAACYFQWVNKPKLSIFVSLLKPLLFQMPLLFILPRLFKLTGVWMTGPVSDILSTAITTVLYYREIKKTLPMIGGHTTEDKQASFENENVS
jgi:putative MATE family efflux protein